jgi:uridine kinase
MSTYLYLNGTSSSGKTTIARSICSIEPRAFHVSADDFGEKFERTLNSKDPEYVRVALEYGKIEDKIKNLSNKSSDRFELFQQYFLTAKQLKYLLSFQFNR